jgi:hypothetical protein
VVEKNEYRSKYTVRKYLKHDVSRCIFLNPILYNALFYHMLRELNSSALRSGVGFIICSAALARRDEHDRVIRTFDVPVVETECSNILHDIEPDQNFRRGGVI